MTEAYEEDWLVRVRAQVMCRDATTGGWLAQGGGGLADVTVGKRPRARRHTKPPSRQTPGVAVISVANESASPGRPITTQPTADTRHQPSASSDAVAEVPREPCFEYFIHGTRICDQVVVLSCTIKKDFQYNKVMPTFHHWVTEEKRFGLTFQTAADARAFDRGVRTAVEELLDGRGGWSLPACRPVAPRDDDADTIFESTNFPESRPGSDHSSDPRHHQRKEQTRASGELLLQASLVPEQRSDADNYSYVQLHPIHEYNYPHLGALQTAASPALKPMSSSSLKKRGCVAQGCPLPLPPPLPAKKPQGADPKITPLRCRHCHEWYLEHNNHAGSCEFAPDCCGTTVNALSAVKCAQCMLYHCMSDAEGEFPVHPCACSPREDGCTTRWLMVCLLSVFVPCLCCYPPLALARAACRRCGAAGGRHAP